MNIYIFNKRICIHAETAAERHQILAIRKELEEQGFEPNKGLDWDKATGVEINIKLEEKP